MMTLSKRPTRIKIDKNRPNKNCKTCNGRGAYHPEDVGGRYLIMYARGSFKSIPCKECWREVEPKSNQ